MGHRINSRAEALEYISHDMIECLECGKKFQFLGSHIKRAHGLSADEYRDRFNIPAGIPLAGVAYRQMQRAKLISMQKSGVIDYSHLQNAEKAARTVGRGDKRDFDRKSQAEHMKSVNDSGRAHRKKLEHTHISKQENILLFLSLAEEKMRPSDVMKCLKMSQSEFLSMLTDGASDLSEREITRTEFAGIAEINPKTIYSYFASTDARDYRNLSDDMRIAMMWRFACRNFRYGKSAAATGKTPLNKSVSRIATLRRKGATVNFTTDELAEKIRESKLGGLKFVRGAHWPNVYLSDFIESKYYTRKSQTFYIVDSKTINLSEASRVLGYKHPSTLLCKLKKLGIGPGSDISAYKYSRTKRKTKSDK